MVNNNLEAIDGIERGRHSTGHLGVVGRPRILSAEQALRSISGSD
jgi:hypothetical protein